MIHYSLLINHYFTPPRRFCQTMGDAAGRFTLQGSCDMMKPVKRTEVLL